MKKNLTILLSLFLLLQIKPAICQTSYVISTDQIYLNAANPIYKSVKAGDTLYFTGGNKNYLLIKGFRGEPGKPIVMINSGGPIIIDTDFYYGINIQNCQYIKFTGTGVPGLTYGFQVKRVAAGAGMSIGGLSSDFEIDHVSIENTMIGGLYAKTDPECDLAAVRSAFTQYNTVIHDNYIGHAGNEGMYIGSTKFTGQDVVCNGKDTLLLPSLLDGVQVYNNIVEYAGWDGIQVSSAYRNCQIYNNKVLFDSQAAVYAQMSGIIMGGGTKAECFNNFISQGKGDGIECHGLGGCRIFNNIIVDAGRSFLPADPTQMKHGMFFTDVSIEKDSSFYIQNNNIINPKSDGIRFSSVNSKNNVIASNIIINPGSYDYYQNGNTSFKGVNSYVMIQDNATDLKLQNNYFSRNADSVKFVSTTMQSPDDFKLLAGSPLIDRADIDKHINFDYSGAHRPSGTKSDIGAFEYPSDTTTAVIFPIIQNITGGGAFCDGGSGIEIGLSSSQNGIIYKLVLNGNSLNNQIRGTGSSVSFGFQTAAGTYTVIGTDTITSASSAMAGSCNVTINSLPSLYSITGGGAYCTSGTGVLVGLNGSQSGVNYQLLAAGINSGSVVPGTGTAISFGLKSTAGVYTVSATKAATGCTATMIGNATISITAVPNTPAVIAGTRSMCAGSTTTLTDATTGGIWSSLNTAVATISSSGVVTGLSAGTVTINYTVTNAGGCTNFSSTTITINAVPTAPGLISGNTSVCKGTTSTLTETTTGGVWSSSNNSTATITTKGVVTGIAAGTAIITYTVTNNSGCTNSTSTNVTVNAPATQPDKFTTSTTKVSKGTSNVIYTVPNVIGVIYKWSYSGSGATISGTTNSVKINFSLTATSGTLNVTASNGCGTSSARSISVSLVKGAVIPSQGTDSTLTVITANPIITNAYDSAVVSTVDTSILESFGSTETLLVKPADPNLKVYPNPTISNATFEFQIEENANVKLEIYSITGQHIARIFDAVVEGGITQTAYLSQSLPSGLYSCVMRWGGKILTKKLIVMQ